MQMSKIRTNTKYVALGLIIMILSPMVGSAVICGTPSSISSNFNGNKIAAGDYIWFTAVVKITNYTNGKPASDGDQLNFTGSTITFTANGTNYVLNPPTGIIKFSSAVAKATTVYYSGNNTWITMVPVGFSDNIFLTGLEYQVPAGGLPGGIKPVTFSGIFSSNVDLWVQWQWAAAVYTSFDTYNKLGVKPLHSTSLDNYNNGDQAGTPENFKAYVTGGATGGGGSNWTGSYSGTLKCQSFPTPIPEFPTIALPVAAIIALIYLFQHRKKMEE